MSITLEGGELKQLDANLIPLVPPVTEGRMVGHVYDAGTSEGVPSARIYIDGVFDTDAEVNGSYKTNYMSLGLHTIRVEASNYQTGEFEVELDREELLIDFELLPLPAGDGWTEGTVVDEVVAIPSLATVGEEVNIKVSGVFPRSPSEGWDVYGTIYINGVPMVKEWFTHSVSFTANFYFTPTSPGFYTAVALDKSATFEVIPVVTGTFYSPFGCVRRPGCIEMVNHIPTAWYPETAVVTEWHTEYLDYGSFRWEVIVPDKWTGCSPYCESETELAEAIVLGHGGVVWGPNWELLPNAGYSTHCRVSSRFRMVHSRVCLKCHICFNRYVCGGAETDHLTVARLFLSHIKDAHSRLPLTKPPAGVHISDAPTGGHYRVRIPEISYTQTPPYGGYRTYPIPAFTEKLLVIEKEVGWPGYSHWELVTEITTSMGWGDILDISYATHHATKKTWLEILLEVGCQDAEEYV